MSKIQYLVKFNFSIMNKKSMVSGKSGEVDITTDVNPEKLKSSDELIGLIADDMARKTKQTILFVEITDVISKSKTA